MKLIREYGTTTAIVIAGAVLLAFMLNPGPHPMEGQMAPPFELARASDGKMVDLASHLGKDVVLLDFWASWCPPCRDGLPKIDAVAKHFAGEPVAVYGINLRESVAQVNGFAAEAGIDLEMLRDDSGLIAEDYGVRGIPQTVLIDKTGRIHKVYVGLGLDFEESLRSGIQDLLDGVGEGQVEGAPVASS